jgi:hypothetical protein
LTKTFLKDPFSTTTVSKDPFSITTLSKNTVITTTVSKDPFLEETNVVNVNVNIDTVLQNQTVAQTPTQPEQNLPEMNEILPTVNQFSPKVVVIERKPAFNHLPNSGIFVRKKLFRINGLQNPYLNYHFRTNYWHSRVKK